jgi:3D (Asp-Asp-Asp) domain-containing protein/predicted small lipoprotein YifL
VIAARANWVGSVRSTLAVMCMVAAAAGCARDTGPLRYPPAVVTSPYRLDGVVVRGASRQWWKLASQPLRYGDPVPVGVTMYCLQGTTRRGRYVRAGIVAADPRYFPLSKYIELYVGRRYLGRFLVDDTGKKIRGARIDIWTASCREARRFGIAPGTAVLVQRPKLQVEQAGKPRPAK